MLLIKALFFSKGENNMFCRICGTKNPSDSKFCIKCGRELVTIMTESEPEAVVEVPVVKSRQRTNLLSSTKLMFQDIFRYGKCMSRAEYWLGMLGLFLLSIGICLEIVGYVFLSRYLFDQESYYMFRIISCFELFIIVTTIIAVFLMNLSATVRRLHDIGLPGAWSLLQYIPIGNIIVLVFMCQPSSNKNNRYRLETQSEFGKKFMELLA
ncbi:DUF805 domain-containing protein [Ligilactobacillus apodemi]|uniref:DUF805 domain-containing protein n=1 Tax=Ligilactobacillus apodemi TaxID=307126 RepID=UPI00214A911A|nr:DUF805 domain-containing protein [Ligilactobacillus apodemi]MCR1900666.1 DUF805 domain-containing protein [Ligilactobacillus apodemi]